MTCYSQNVKSNINMSDSETAHHERLPAASPTIQPQLSCLLTVQPLLTQSAAFLQTSLTYSVQNITILHRSAWNTIMYVITLRGECVKTLTKQSVVYIHLFRGREGKRKWFFVSLLFLVPKWQRAFVCVCWTLWKKKKCPSFLLKKRFETERLTFPIEKSNRKDIINSHKNTLYYVQVKLWNLLSLYITI